mmetsp:Transcript_26984/g.44491  ORF Transcript_26984/g.44491 Transcript_26984/m.44491 type:complete len:101 (+) Transcript_26984:735-1037(+)
MKKNKNNNKKRCAFTNDVSDNYVATVDDGIRNHDDNNTATCPSELPDSFIHNSQTHKTTEHGPRFTNAAAFRLLPPYHFSGVPRWETTSPRQFDQDSPWI